MKWLANLSIRSKIVAINVVSATLALTLACAGLMVLELRTHGQTLEHEVAAMASMTAAATTAAITFNDSVAARESLHTLTAVPEVTACAVYLMDGRVLAQVARPQIDERIPAVPGPAGFHSATMRLRIFEPILLEGRQIGWIYVSINTESAHQKLLSYMLLLGVVFLASSLVSAFVSAILQRVISGPILHLAGTAGEVARGRDYRIRARKFRNDEVGELVDRFNEMLGEVHSRDEALRAAQESLELRVKERTQELEGEIASRRAVEENLRSAMEVAEEASRAKSSFLANMSHEFRTPLNAIIGYSEMLEEEAMEMQGTEQCVSDLHKIRGAGLHLLSLINDVLDLSKIEAGRMEIQLETVDLAAVIQEVSALMEPLAVRSGSRIGVVLPPDSLIVETDPMRFRQSLLNLASNACRFTQNGLVEIRASRYRKGNGEWVSIAVRDTGIGIDPNLIGLLFKPFRQVDSSRSRKHDGTGLGLAISQRLCRMMHGQITVDSEKGVGSTFTIHLPCQQPAPLAAEEPASGQGARGGGALKARLLLIDDDNNSAHLIMRQFAREGIAVDRASTGEEGLARLESEKHLAVVLDLRLPGMSGQQVLDRLIHRHRGRLPIFIHSILDQDSLDTRQRGSIRGFYQKPLDSEKLIGAVVQAVAAQQRSPSTAAVRFFHEGD